MAGNALEAAARGDVVGLGAIATRTHSLAIVLRPTHFAERLVSLVLAHLEHGLEAQCAGGGGEERVLHAIVSSAYALYMMARTEERRVGQRGVSQCCKRWTPYL